MIVVHFVFIKIDENPDLSLKHEFKKQSDAR